MERGYGLTDLPFTDPTSFTAVYVREDDSVVLDAPRLICFHDTRVAKFRTVSVQKTNILIRALNAAKSYRGKRGSSRGNTQKTKKQKTKSASSKPVHKNRYRKE